MTTRATIIGGVDFDDAAWFRRFLVARGYPKPPGSNRFPADKALFPADWRYPSKELGATKSTLYRWLRDHRRIPEHVRNHAMTLMALREIADSGRGAAARLAGEFLTITEGPK